MTLAQNRILLVGGTSGLGLAVARAVAERGATPLVASRNPASVEKALCDLPPHARGTTVDLTDPGSVAGLAGWAGPVDHLVYTAGEPLSLTMLADLTPQVVHDFFDTRLVGALSVIRAVRVEPTGSIVLTGGNAGQRPAPGWALGASVCGAMDALTRQLALELAPVRVNLVAPGVTRSPLWSNLRPADEQAMYDGLAAAVPVRRVAETEDVALAYVYAMEQRMATGTSILVDGGAVLV